MTRPLNVKDYYRKTRSEAIKTLATLVRVADLKSSAPLYPCDGRKMHPVARCDGVKIRVGAD